MSSIYTQNGGIVSVYRKGGGNERRAGGRREVVGVGDLGVAGRVGWGMNGVEFGWI